MDERGIDGLDADLEEDTYDRTKEEDKDGVEYFRAVYEREEREEKLKLDVLEPVYRLDKRLYE